MSDENKMELAHSTGGQLISAQDVARQIGTIQELMKGVMQEGTHYGKIPGCGDKPTLLQPGAQTLGLTFQIYADPIEHVVTDLPGGHREIRTKVAMRRLSDDKIVAYGFGTCSTMESRYRFRRAEPKIEVLDEPIPPDYGQNKAKYAKKGLGCRKVEGAWVWCKITDSGEKTEHDNPADYFNTVDKISFKRAYVHGTINATACSDIFTQDIEDMAELIRGESQFVSKPDVSPPPYKKEEQVAGKKEPEQKPEHEQKQPEKKETEQASEKPAKQEHEKEPDIVEMPEQMKEGIKAGFADLSDDFDDAWFDRMTPMPAESDRNLYVKLYNAVNNQIVKIDDVVSAENIDAALALIPKA